MRAFVSGVIVCVVLVSAGALALDYFSQSTEEATSSRSTKVHASEP
jgi:hypothetical protein